MFCLTRDHARAQRRHDEPPGEPSMWNSASPRHWRIRTAGAAVSAAALIAAPMLPAHAAAGPVSTSPASFTPYLDPNVGAQNVHQLAQCGTTMYAVGAISSVKRGTASYTRNNAFSFSASTGAMTSWNPDVSGRVNAIALSPDCSTAYLGGQFSSVHGTAVKNLAAVDTSTGAVIGSFAHNAAAPVLTIQYTGGRVLVGGQFGKINGQDRSKMASLDPATGSPTGYLNLTFTGQYPNSSVPTKVYNSQLSHSGSRLLIEGVFTSISGSARQQVAVLNLGASSVSVNGWHASEFDSACSSGSEAFYAKSATWSPDDA